MAGEEDAISEAEVKEALKTTKNGKGVGPDQMPAEAWKSLGEAGIRLLTEFLNTVMKEETIPTDGRDSRMVPILKEKGNIRSCANYRGNKLTNRTMKLPERVMD